MENLDHLKDIWKNQSESSMTFSKEDIHDMVHRRSSSIVKWILIISILEFALPYMILPFTGLNAGKKVSEQFDLNLSHLITYYSIFHFVVIGIFIYYFYKNYRNISAGSSVKALLGNILRTRRTVKYYIYYNITIMGILGIHSFYMIFNSESFLEQLPAGTDMTLIWVVAIGLYSIALLLVWVFYRLVYGFFLRKLKKNYAELKKRE